MVTDVGQSQRTPAERHADIVNGIRTGLGYAAFFSVVAAAGVILGASIGASGNPALIWILATLFYAVAGAAGGALFGLLRPLRRRYVGRLLTAYVILLLVYGGGTIAFWPVISDGADNPPLLGMLGLWALLCLIIAPLYVAASRSWS